ncbi:MAG: hypothetical protein ACI8XO_005092 [Verrucomicrobiales bacterium]
MATTLSDRSLAQRILHVLKRLVVHPLGHFALFIFFLYQVKEFYPFTHIPMYSDPESAAPYLYLADGDGEPLGVKSHGGITNPKMRKMYRARLDRYCRENDLDKNNPPQEAIDTIAGEVFDFLRKHSVERGNPLPETLRLMHVYIEQAPPPDGFKETTTRLSEQTAPAQ